jgi:uncharacterized protein YbjT (DUF2867 family)
MKVLVTGATGYIGGRLVPALLEAGHEVRCLARDPRRLAGRAWRPRVEVTEGDVLRSETLGEALRGVDAAFYLVHSMGSGSGFHERDIVAARNFGRAAAAAGVTRIIYLGGLGEDGAELSPHLRSRQDTGRALSEAGVPVTEFRAAVIVGSGSLSFEMIRYLAERVPLMICPRWVYTRTQPVAIGDVIAYLVTSLVTPESRGRVLEIGGADVVTYGEMMTGYARARGLRRALVPVPVLTPRLSSYWVHIVTPIPANIAQPLVEGLRNEVVVRDDAARRVFPSIVPVNYDAAVRNALAQLDANSVETAWSDALMTTQGDRTPVVLTTLEGMIIERRQEAVSASPADVYRAFSTLGGERGWRCMTWAWRVRGAIDRFLGGVGMRRGRRDPVDLRPGDALDFWRVEAVEPGRLLRLRAEMKLPGRAWLEFEARPRADGATLTQTALFAPRGLGGLAYWYGLYPVHRVIFRGMVRALAADAAKLAASPGAPRV